MPAAAKRARPPARAPSHTPRPAEDGFGNPDVKHSCEPVGDAIGPFHQVLYALGAHSAKIVTLVVMEYCDKASSIVTRQRFGR